MDRFYTEQIEPFREVNYITDSSGYIVWRLGTGRNVELLHMRTYKQGSGAGRYLLKRMVGIIGLNPPYATVFGFTRVNNEIAQEFYKALGFDLTTVKGVYDDGEAVVFSQRFEELKKLLEVE